MRKGPSMRAGVRQGCPLSVILFAICVDVLMRKLGGVLCEHEMLRAYADDIALVVKDYNRSAGIISQWFDAFGEISALKLNIKKTLFIPLWPL